MTGGMGHNGMSRDEWLFSILRSGQVTRIAQHLALVIYHMADPATNIAKMSARDLEEITGWGRTAIRQHIDELEIFIRVTWGAGRAKTLFELQGVITEAVKPLRESREMARQTATTANQNGTPDGHKYSSVNGNVAPNGHNGLSVVASHAATSSNLPPRGHNSGHMNHVQTATTGNGTPDGHNGATLWPATRPQTANGGDYRGGNLDSEVINHHHQGSAHALDDVEVPAYQIHDDGSFSGTAFEHFTATEIGSMRAAYPALDIFPELINADAFLAIEFEKDGTPFASKDRRARLHMFLLKRQREAHERILVAMNAARQKNATEDDDSCWFDDSGQLQVANGFRADLLALANGDEGHLRRTLDKCAGNIGIDMKGRVLLKNVRSSFAKHLDWSGHDERKTRAVERRGKPDGAVGQPTESENDRTKRMIAEAIDGKR